MNNMSRVYILLLKIDEKYVKGIYFIVQNWWIIYQGYIFYFKKLMNNVSRVFYC